MNTLASAAPIPASATLFDQTRQAALILTHTNPTDTRLRAEITARGAVEMAAILTGSRETPDDFDNWTTFSQYTAKTRTFSLSRILIDMDKGDMRFIIPGDAEWPVQLNDLEFPPFGLFLAGDGTFPAQDQMIALVGSRDASGYGLSVTGDLAAGMSGRGYTIVSGGGFGIDAQAHRAAMAGAREGSMGTIAVMPCGLDRFYPAGCEDVLLAVKAQGLLVSELPPGSAPGRSSHLLRNRIIAALAGVTVVTEARWRSGALHAAEHAKTLGRPVAAVPGSVYSAQSAGCHRLLREGGAVLVTDAIEVAELAMMPLLTAGAPSEQ